MRSVGIQSLAVAFPDQIRTNAYFREKCPEVVATAEQKSLNKVWSPQAGSLQPVDHFNEAMGPYLSDPFRGTVERRVTAGTEEGARSLSLRAVREAIAQAGIPPGEIDLLISSALLPDACGIGDAAYLAQELGLKGAAFNFESACSASLVGLQTACAMVQSGQYRNAVVVVACTYSKGTDENDSLGWTCGDGAAAYLVGPLPDGYGLLGAKTVHTGSTCGAMFYEHTPEGMRLRAAPHAGKSLKTVSESSLLTCCEAALQTAGVSLDEIDFFVFNTPLAWYTDFCARTLKIPKEKTINTYAWYANTGPVLMPTNLFHAAKEGKIRDGDRVLLYTIGSVSSAGAAVMRWKDVPLGRNPQEGRPAASLPPRG